MAYETKVILALLAQQIARAETLEEAYRAVEMAANVEGVNLPSYEELREKFGEKKK
jgi:hypothetical protein